MPPSVAMLESMPALESLSYWANLINPTKIVDLEPIILALNRGMAFRQLQALSLTSYHIENAAAWDRMQLALAGAACALRLTSLELSFTSFSLKNMSTLSTLLSENTFPRLQTLELTDNALGDQGVEILVQGLLAPACGTRLTKLNLSQFEFGDQGMSALARVVREGRFERLEDIDLSYNLDVTNQGVRVLARAVQDAGDRGLPMLLQFTASWLRDRRASFEELASALMDNCPCMEVMDFGLTVDFVSSRSYSKAEQKR